LGAPTPDTFTREAPGRAGRDPMTFATNSGFSCFRPALILG